MPQMLQDKGYLKRIRLQLEGKDPWESAQRSPGQLLRRILAANRGHPGYPDEALLDEARSIFACFRDEKLLDSIFEAYGLEEREAFWLCLGLGLGGKVVFRELEQFTAAVNDHISMR